MVRVGFIDEVTSEQINMGAHANTCRRSVAGHGNMPDACLRDSTGSLVARMERARVLRETFNEAILDGGGRLYRTFWPG